MTFLFFTSLLLVEILATPSQSGTVVRTSQGRERQSGRRRTRAAKHQPESLTNSAANVAMARIVETDANGRYFLDDIPQGRYFISGGRLDQPAYYPGAKEMMRATTFYRNVGHSSLRNRVHLESDQCGTRGRIRDDKCNAAFRPEASR